ncbi:uncharacterized protein C8R40DRAFT_1059276, partial [Lentinula edodes]|uniref:uncharacterized protein n=1 Tax=Lentinula edodes TaxID=5353 RepID=UPI001E8E4D4B
LPEFTEPSRKSYIINAINTAYQATHGNDIPGVFVKGVDFEAQVSELEKIMEKALEDDDWTLLFSNSRHFVKTDIDASGEEVWVTSGGGFERSVLLLLFQKYFEKRFEELCTPLIDCYYTLSTVPMSSTTPISETKRRDLGLFGATVALALVNGYLPEKLNPLLLVYFLSDCQFECLNRTAVMDLFPELGNAIQTSALTNRTKEMHNSIAHHMLHNAIIGPAEINHPYFQAFIKGFRLSCKNHYTLPQASLIVVGEHTLNYCVIDFPQLCRRFL